MGTGENALHPEFDAIVAYLAGRGVKLSIASNGYSLTVMPDDVLRAFHDVEVSIDFATETEQDAFRGAGNWALVHQAMDRCHRLGVEVSILATLMRTNTTRWIGWWRWRGATASTCASTRIRRSRPTPDFA